jgi:hypothetical protein
MIVTFAGSLISADVPASRVLDAGKRPEDVRLTKVVDLDHPAPFEPAFAHRLAWEQRAKALREQLLVANGLWPMPEKTPLHPVIHGAIERDDYTVEKVYFASLPGHYVCGSLYRPKGTNGKRPGVLCPHGHWANGRFYENSAANAKKEIEAGAEKTMEGAQYPLQARCAMLARMGCVVFHYDMVGTADSQFIAHRAGFSGAEAELKRRNPNATEEDLARARLSDAEAELRLQSAMGLQTWNSIRALDFITSLPEVDPQRIGVTGASGGGTQTFILCAVDERPAIAFPAVMVSMNMQGGCICENCSLLRVGANNVEIAALFAPKPLMMSGANDWTKDIETRGLPELKAIYRLYNAEGNVNARYTSFPHNYNQVSREMMYNWFNKHLKLGLPEPVVEKPFQPIPPKQLSVFDDQHRPTDATGAAEVRKHMTAASDKQIAELAKKPDEFRKVAGAALRAMIADQYPDKVEIVPNSLKTEKRDGYEIHKSLLTRPGSGEQIPAIGIVPAGWNKAVTIWVHPEGKASMFQPDGQPVAVVKQLLDKKIAVLGADLFMTGEFVQPDQPTPPTVQQIHHKDIPFAGYHLGYNRSVLANRVHDLLTLISFARGVIGAREIDLAGFGAAGPCALLARALAGDVVSWSVIDLNGFDFDRVHSLNDEMLLSGARKYGGIFGFAALCDSGKTVLYNLPKEGRTELAQMTKSVTLHEGKVPPEQVWALK